MKNELSMGVQNNESNLLASAKLHPLIPIIVKKILGHFSWNIKTIVLSGSLATGEYVEPPDLDLIVVTHFYDPFLSLRIRPLWNRIPVKVDLSQFPLSHFNNLSSMMIVDAKNTGHVIYGDNSILRNVDPSSVFRYDAVKLFFNFCIINFVACVSKEMLQSNKISEAKKMNVIYGCMKAYEGICASLLTLRKKYTLGYIRRAKHFSEIYRNDFPLLYNTIPDLAERVMFVTKFRSTHKLDFDGDIKELWFRTREDIRIALPYIMKEYFGKSRETLIDNLMLLNEIPHQFVNSLLYTIRLFVNLKKCHL